MFGNHYMHRYVLMKKSTLFFAGLAAAGLVGYHFYKYHHEAVKKGVDQIADDVSDVAKKGVRKAKEVAEEVKS